jgi:uncharacterized protein YpuA (DUF1002 family)
MAWTKVKTAMIIGAGVLVAGTAIHTLCNLAWIMRSIPADWSAISGDREQWKWANGKIIAHSTTGDSILASGRDYDDFTLSSIVKVTHREASLAIRMQDANNGYLVVFTPWNAAGRISLVKRTDGNEVTLDAYRGRVPGSPGSSAKITVTARGPVLEVRLNNVKVLKVEDTTYTAGLIGLRIFGEPKFPCDATFASVTYH